MRVAPEAESLPELLPEQFGPRATALSSPFPLQLLAELRVPKKWEPAAAGHVGPARTAAWGGIIRAKTVGQAVQKKSQPCSTGSVEKSVA